MTPLTDRVFIRHPDHPDRNGYATRTAFDSLWSRKGYVIEDDGEPPHPLPAPAGRPEGPGGTAEPPPSGGDGGDTTPARSREGLNDELDEKARLRDQLETLGIEVDGRWGLKRLRTELATAEDTGA